MFKSSWAKFFFAFASICFASCSYLRGRQTPAESSTPPAAFATSDVKSDVPFATKEPEIYQAEILITTAATSRTIFVTRSGERRAIVYNPNEKTALTRLEQAGGTTFSIYDAGKIYTETAPQMNAGAADSGFPMTELLNQKPTSAFENAGMENNLTKFRVRLGTANSTDSEVLIFYDEALQLPVRQEFYVGIGTQKTLTYAVELKNFKPEADERFFELPKDCRRVSPHEFGEIVRRERAKK